MGRLYDQLFEDRQEGDYVVFISFEPAYVETQLKECIDLSLNLIKPQKGVKVTRNQIGM